MSGIGMSLRGVSLPALLSVLCASIAIAQPHKASLQNGHVSPLSAKITYADGNTRTVMALGIGNSGGYRTHTIDFFGEGGAVVTVWLDDIRKIQDATEDDALVIFRDGTERRLEWTCNGCQRDPMMRSAYLRTLFFANPQDADEKVDLAKVKSVEFLAPARKDKEGHAMFDNWHFSPFTGEKLPEK